MILIIPALTYTQTYDYKYADNGKSNIKLIIVNQIANAKKLPQTGYRLYHDILITPEDLKEALVTDFTNMGIANQIGMAEKVITCESNFLWYAQNPVSKGVAQFTRPTYQAFCQGDYDDMNPFLQLSCMAKMWATYHLQSRWDCYNILYGIYKGT